MVALVENPVVQKKSPMGRRLRGPKPSSLARLMARSQRMDEGGKPIWKSKRATESFSQPELTYLNRLERVPRWAKRFMERVSKSTGDLPTRCLDGRFWMAWRSGFRPLRDDVWEWWLKIDNVLAYNEFYDLGMQWRRLGRETKLKGNHQKILDARSVSEKVIERREDAAIDRMDREACQPLVALAMGHVMGDN